MTSTLFSRSQYLVFFSLLAVAYIVGLFVPLMDNDSAHHANIALRMYLTGDYVNLIDHGKDYLDKPHLHFWLASWSYSVFGVAGFAYKLPSFLFTLLGTYSTYRLGKALYDAEVGQLAALIVASSFAYVLANNDVRMDAILTASIVLATWQGVEWVNRKRVANAVGLALGLALGFCTKGHIAVFTPGIGLLAYIVYKKDWKSFYHPQLLIIIAAFALFIAPVVYCYYLQYDLHPEKVIRGKSGRSGVAFILWQQNFERFQGDSFGADAKNDYLFFFHSFLWAFAPWAVMAFIAFFKRIRSIVSRRAEWLTPATFTIMALMISFSGFKLPHYLNIIFPATAVLSASYIIHRWRQRKPFKGMLITQVVICSLCLVAVGVLSVWAFPATNWALIGGFLFMAAVAARLIWGFVNGWQKVVGASVVTSAMIFLLLNGNFYQQLLTYQGGNSLAFATKGRVDTKRVWFWPGIYSSSYNFYTSALRKEVTDSVLQQPSPVWIVTDSTRLPELSAKGLQYLESYRHDDYEITQLQLPFINPGTRKKELGSLHLVRIK